MDIKVHFSQLRKKESNDHSQLINGQTGFRQNLGDALFSGGYWFQSISENIINTDISENIETVQDKKPLEVPEKEKQLNEKANTLNALEEFVIDKTENKEEGSKSIKFKGGELKVKPAEDTLPTLSLNYGPEALDKNQKVKYLFLGDTYKKKENSEEEMDLLANMIIAMKLGPEEYVRMSYEDSDYNGDEFKKIASVIYSSQPDIVITLGAVATNNLIGKRERLSRVHGKIFNRLLSFKNKEEFKIHLMPVFHPDFLKINPNMKRAAWIDLQKAMEYLENL